MDTREMKPVRRGRLAGTGDWRSQYQALKVTADEAAALIRNCRLVELSSPHDIHQAHPKVFLQALEELKAML